MSTPPLQLNSLVLYKTRPARVIGLGEKIEIELEGGKSKRVRDKDIHLLHPGPLLNLKGLEDRLADAREAWELLEGEGTSFAELLTLVFDNPRPADAWSLWLLVADGLYFSGDPERLHPRAAGEVERERAARAQKAAEEQAWQCFLDRLGQAAINQTDRERLAEVERVALGTSAQSRVLDALKIEASPENGYRLLVDVGYWPADHNPHPGRQGLPLDSPPDSPIQLPDEPRLDLTGLEAWAIDDEYSNDPDDAISLDGERLWVHVADVAALVAPDSPMDLEARARGANLYLPEGVSNMLPPRVTEMLGLGLQRESPALSIGFRLSAEAVPEEIEIHRSRIVATRISYAEANQRLGREPFARIKEFSDRYRARRQAAGAAGLELPEVSVRLRDGQPLIHPLERLGSRDLVTDLMLMAGEAVALFCQRRDIPVPFAVQPAPDEPRTPQTLSEMVAYRRFFKPTRSSTSPSLHSGLGLAAYVRVTSPLRRYQDLLVHQQLRAHLRGEALLSADQVSLRAAQADEGAALRRRVERLSNQHWKLVWLRQHPDWRGPAVVVAMDERKATLLIPELAMEIQQRMRDGLTLNAQVSLKLRELDLAGQTVYFQLK